MDINGKTFEELSRLLAEKREALRNFRFHEAGSRSRNVKEGHTLRKDIARILTQLTTLSNEAREESAKVLAKTDK